MQRYFFNLYNDVVTLDEEGQDLASADVAHDLAIGKIRDIVKEGPASGPIALAHRIEIVDEFGRILRTVSFAEAVKAED
jgi:hypothetical protein